MGLQLNVDLECIAGPTKEAYVRIDTYRVDKVSSKLKFSVTYWLSAKHAQDFNRTYLEDSLNQARGILSNKAVYYPTPDSDGIEVELPTFSQLDMANEQGNLPKYCYTYLRDELGKIVPIDNIINN